MRRHRRAARRRTIYHLIDPGMVPGDQSLEVAAEDAASPPRTQALSTPRGESGSGALRDGLPWSTS